jgi:hypothetical protein
LERTKNCLQIRLAGIKLTEAGEKYIHQSYGAFKVEPNVWFTLVHRQEELLYCEVMMKRVGFAKLH